jgi:hypothetical protein
MKMLWQVLLLLGSTSIIMWLAITRPIVFHNNPYISPIIIAPESLRERVEILSRGLGPRDADHPENLGKIAEYLAAEFKSHGARVSFQDFEVHYTGYRNVIAEYGPETGQVVVIGAHYDSAGDQPGADDNASGVAGLLDLSRLLSHANLTYRIMLAAYTLEEPPYFRTKDMGSAVHARSLRERGISVKLMISLEMSGYFSNQENSQNFPMPLLKIFYPSQGNFILVVDQLFSSHGAELKKWMIPASDLPVYSINAPAIIPGVDFSDHLNFWNHGYSAVMVTDTAFLRNDAYHTGRDTADRLDYTKMAKVVQGVYRYVTQAEQTK